MRKTNLNEVQTSKITELEGMIEKLKIIKDSQQADIKAY